MDSDRRGAERSPPRSANEGPRGAGAPHERLIAFVADRPGHDHRYAIDPARIRAELGWRPSVTLAEGLARTVDWYLANEPWWRDP